MSSVLRAEDLVKEYGGRRVVDRVTIEVRQGEIVGLLGPNGAGKTTTFYLIVGLVRPQRGRVLLEGRDLSGMPMYKRARMGIGYLSQEPSVFRGLTALQNITAVLEVQGVPKEERERRAREILERLGIGHLAGQKADTLSGGERRRLEIARALVLQPRFMLLDEPFVGVDPIAVEDVQKIVVQLKEWGIGVLITDHNVRETLRITDRAYIMADGKILVEGS
ncbi:MAG TPA: LPS export ABC transporter ATP-binding protein, partial [Candidatus Latescibacteria bacterium]|nr:LPS export ABC transporter ATP-binding protein [Candidatus Latescibacterota bacterium]